MSLTTASNSSTNGITADELRKVNKFGKYAQFNATTTHKSELASLCVSLRSCLERLQEESITINKVLFNAETQINYMDMKKQLEAIKAAKIVSTFKLAVILGQVWNARNHYFEKKLPEFTRALDLFNNITDVNMNAKIEAIDEPKSINAINQYCIYCIKSINALHSQFDEYVDRLQDKDVALNEAQYVARMAEQKLLLANQKIRHLTLSSLKNKTTTTPIQEKSQETDIQVKASQPVLTGVVKNKGKCFKCGEIGHIRRDCPSSSAENDGSENEDNEVDKDDVNSAKREFSGKYSVNKNKDHVVC